MEEVGTFPIKLADKTYYIDIGSWKARDVTDFSPKTTVPGTGAVFGDLQMHQPISFNNWQHGFGFIWHEDEAGYLSTDGNIDTRHERSVMMYTASTSSDTNNNDKDQGLVFLSNFFTRGAAGLRYYSGGSWAGVNIQRPIFDATSENSGTGIATGGTITASHTITTEGASRALFVGVIIENSTNVTNVTAVYGTLNMTLVTDSSVGTTPNVRAFYLLAVPPGTNNIVVTYTISAGTIEALIIGASFIYVNQTTLFDVVTTEAGWAGITNTISPTAAANELVLDFLAKDGAETDTAAVQLTGQTQIAQEQELTGADIHGCASYFHTTSSDTTPDIQWNWTNARDWAHLAIPINPIAETQIDILFENGEYIFAQPTGQRLMRSTSGTANWVPAGANNASSAYSWVEMHGGYIFAGKTSEAQVYFDSNSNLSSLYGDPADDADEMIAGPGTTGTLFGISYLEKLAVARTDGLWTMDTNDATTTAWISKRTLNFANLKATVNFRTMATNGGSLYFTIQDKIIYEWNGARLQDITPSPITDVWPYTTYYRFDNFTPFGTWLLMSARTSDTEYTESIIAWDGVGFHKLLDPITDGDGTISMISVDTANNYLWFHVTKPTAGTNTTYYIEYQTTSDFPYANFPTTGTHRVTTSRVHAGFRRVDKSMPILWTECDNVTATRYIRVQYAIDDSDTFYTWDDLTAEGINILTLPQNKLTEEFKYIRLRFIFVTDATAETPVLEGATMMVMMRPDFKMGYSFDILGGTGVASGMFEDDRTGYSIMKDLRDARNSKGPIELETPFGDHVYGYLTSLSEAAMEYEPEDYEGGKINILQVIRCNFAEVMTVSGDPVEPEWN